MVELTDTITQFEVDVLTGLKADQKHLSSKYFYDVKGDEIFQKIMHTEEYYLTQKETEIFECDKQKIFESLSGKEPFRIIELGAGDGLKTKILLQHFLECDADFTYTPVDISENALKILEQNLHVSLSNLKIESYQGDYFDALAEISSGPERDVVFFLGSNVGNFSQDEAVRFLTKLRNSLKPSDLLFMGVDMKKDPSIILSAYNDASGITRDFNLNLLDRINRELDGSFDRNKFLHYPYYNPHTGECRSYLISKIQQHVEVAGEKISFRPWESIFMEISKKYDDLQLNQLAQDSGFKPIESFYDKENWFVDVVWESIG